MLCIALLYRYPYRPHSSPFFTPFLQTFFHRLAPDRVYEYGTLAGIGSGCLSDMYLLHTYIFLSIWVGVVPQAIGGVVLCQVYVN